MARFLKTSLILLLALSAISGVAFWFWADGRTAMPSADALADLVSDALIAQSGQQREDLWAILDDIDTLFEKLNPPKAFDVSLAIPLMADYVEEVREQLAGLSTPVRMVTFGHLGDGNIHLVMKGSSEPGRVSELERAVYESLGRRGGVISAEHGIGLEKRPYLRQSRSAEEVALMRKLKTALDPGNILNPGKILEPGL